MSGSRPIYVMRCIAHYPVTQDSSDINSNLFTYLIGPFLKEFNMFLELVV